jgi:hypothetical protein
MTVEFSRMQYCDGVPIWIPHVKSSGVAFVGETFAIVSEVTAAGTPDAPLVEERAELRSELIWVPHAEKVRKIVHAKIAEG